MILRADRWRRKSREVNWPPLSVPRVNWPGRKPRSRTAAWTQAIASSSRQRSSNDQPTSSQVQVLYMAVPRLADELPFYLLDPEHLRISPWEAATKEGAATVGRKVAATELPSVDLVICASVAVNREGARIGKGGGFSDLEVAFLVEAGVIRPDTVLATTVHPLQVVEEPLPETIHVELTRFGRHLDAGDDRSSERRPCATHASVLSAGVRLRSGPAGPCWRQVDP